MGSLPGQIANVITVAWQWLTQNGGGVVIVVGAVAAGVAWYVYRDNVRSQRESVLDALSRELEVHRWWVGNEYPGTAERWWEKSSARAVSTVIFKLSTVAVDAAIANGSSLFLDRGLLPALVGYRQQLGHFNQLVDQAAALQASPELWRRFPSGRLVRRLRDLLALVHLDAIGDAHNGRAYYYFQQVAAALGREKRMRLRAAVWITTGVLRFRR